MRLVCGDALEELAKLPDRSVDLVLADPPYNVGVQTIKNGRKTTCQWDKIDGYADWFLGWVKECQRVLKPSGVFYFFHNDMAQIAELMERIKWETEFVFVSFCIWDKGETYRSRSWRDRDPEGKTALRCWFNRCEYCLHYFLAPKTADASWGKTGLERINSNPNCYRPIKEWYQEELKRLGLTSQDIAKAYTQKTGKKPYMLRHYFQNSQFEIPTEAVWRLVYEPLGFQAEFGGDRGYEALRQEYEEMRNYHRCDKDHCNVWRVPPIPSTGRYHTCQKPLEILERIIRVSCRPGGTVLDPFMGSGSTGVACLHTGREFIGIERDRDTYCTATERVEREKSQMRWEV